jgi:hypothetical protein
MERLASRLSPQALIAARERLLSLLQATTRRGWLAERVSASQLLLALGMPELQVRALLPDAEPAVRLLLLQRPRADVALVERSLRDGSAEVRLAAARRLAQGGDARARPVLQEALQQHHEVAQAAALLTALGEPHLDELLGELEPSTSPPQAGTETEAARRIAAARASMLLPVSSRAAVLQRAARDVLPAVRLALLDAAAEEASRAPAAPPLQTLRVLAADPHPGVRARAAALLARALHSGVRTHPDEAVQGEGEAPAAAPAPERAASAGSPASETTERPSAAPVPPVLARALKAGRAAAARAQLGRALQELRRARLLCTRKLKAAPACAQLAPQLALELAQIYDRQQRWPEAMHEYQSVVRSDPPAAVEVMETAREAIERLAPRLAQLVLSTRIKGTCRHEVRWLLPGAVRRSELPSGRARSLALKAGEVVRLGSCS